MAKFDYGQSTVAEGIIKSHQTEATEKLGRFYYNECVCRAYRGKGQDDNDRQHGAGNRVVAV